MSSLLSSSDNEVSFLRKIREELAPDVGEPRSRNDFLHIFKSIDDRQIFQRITSRNDLDFQGLVSSFKENALPLNLKVHLADSFDDAAEIIVQISRESDPEFGDHKHIIQHVHPDVQKLQLWQRLAEEPISVHTTYQNDTEVLDKTRASFIGITAADWGVAESATLIQLTAPERPRSTSLVPSIHVGIIRQTRLLSTLQEGYTMLRRSNLSGSVTFISGPSKTADIEAHMVHGAHGPREMHVVIIKDTPEKKHLD